jgi:hypothetical protein
MCVWQYSTDLAAANAVDNKKLSLVTPMSEADVILAWIEIYGLIASKGTASRKAR